MLLQVSIYTVIDNMYSIIHRMTIYPGGSRIYSRWSYFSPAATATVEGKMSKGLKKVLKKVFASEVQEQLAVADAKLGSVIKVTHVTRH